MEKKCLDCGEPLVGRKDKKFCSDQCRNTYNNKLKSDVNNFVRNINNTLRKNRRILAELNPNGKSKVRKEELLNKGFNFNYYTNTFETKSGNIYHFCYEQGYLKIDEPYYTLVLRKEYVE